MDGADLEAFRQFMQEQAGKRKQQEEEFKGYDLGATLVEMLVTLTLITVMVGMAATTLSAAFKIFLRVQKEQYAQSVLDTTMTELRSLTKELRSM